MERPPTDRDGTATDLLPIVGAERHGVPRTGRSSRRPLGPLRRGESLPCRRRGRDSSSGPPDTPATAGGASPARRSLARPSARGGDHIDRDHAASPPSGPEEPRVSRLEHVRTRRPAAGRGGAHEIARAGGPQRRRSTDRASGVSSRRVPRQARRCRAAGPGAENRGARAELESGRDAARRTPGIGRDTIRRGSGSRVAHLPHVSPRPRRTALSLRTASGISATGVEP